MHNITKSLAYIASLLCVSVVTSGLASSWSPTLLVNTEAFQIIDEGDGSSDVSVQFGDTLNETITFERGSDHFNFSDDIFVAGDVTTTGTYSGNGLTLSNVPNCDLLVTDTSGTFACGSTETGGHLATIQIRRDTDFTMAATNTYYDVTFNNTDVESEPGVLEHNNTNTERIDIKNDGYYLISYHVNANNALVTHQLNARVRINNTTTLLGSFTVGRNYQNEYSPNVSTNVVYLQDGDFVTLQVSRTTANTVINETVLTVTKLTGIQGEKGDKGDPGNLDTSAAEDVFVNQGGDTMTGNLLLSNNAEVQAGGNITLNSDNGATDAILTFGNDALAETLRFSDTSNAFEFSDDLIIAGDAYAQTNRFLPQIIHMNNTQSGITGAGWQTIDSFTLPGGTLGTGNAVRIVVWTNQITGGGGASYRIVYGGQTLASMGNNTNNPARIEYILKGNGATNAQRALLDHSNSGNTGTAEGSSTVDSTTNQTVSLQMDLQTDSDVINRESVVAEVLK